MKQDTIIEAVTDYFMDCPLLKDGAFRLDALGDKAIEYTIEVGVFDPVVARMINGDALKRFQFSFGSREMYTLDRLQNIENSGFYEKFSEWVEEQNRNENYPELPEKCTPWELNVLSSGYLFDANNRTARYQIQLELQYYQEV